MKVLHALVTTLLGPRFPSGLLILTGILMLASGDARGLPLLLGAVAWTYFQEAILIYGSTTGRIRETPLKLFFLCATWCGVVYVSYYVL